MHLFRTFIKIFLLAIVLGAILYVVEESYASESYGPYRVDVIRVIDGDTLVLDVHLWLGLIKTINLRVTGVDVPELTGKTPCERNAAQEAKAFVEQWVEGATNLTIVDVTPDKFGTRVNGYLYKGEDNLTDVLIDSKHGRPYTGTRRVPWCAGFGNQ